MPDYDAITVALAARFAPAQVTPPTGYDNITISTGDLPDSLLPVPCVLVIPEDSTFTHSAGKRDGVHNWIVRFYFNQNGDIERDTVAVRKWATVLVNQLQIGAQLGGIVTQAKVLTLKMGVFQYASGTIPMNYTGLELGVMINTNEPWSPTS